MAGSRICTIAALALAAALLAHAGDAGRGKQLFSSERCAVCHSIKGKGGAEAPDLGEPTGRDYTPFHLATLMWNHAPKMWEAMEQRNVPRPVLGERDADDLFAYLYSVRHVERPGDAERGKQVFQTEQCTACHGLTEVKPGTDAKPVVDWQSRRDPILLMEDMWRHAGQMERACAQRKIAWPVLSAQDLADLSEYLRQVPKTHLAEPDMTGVDSQIGAALFDEKGCESCHPGRFPLEKQRWFQTPTAVAAAIWDHAPEMAAAKPVEPGEMRQIVSYVWERQFTENTGNAPRGEQVFNKKGCARCHDGSSPHIPKLPRTGQHYSAVCMIAVLWQHGPQMLSQMKAQKIAWPLLSDREMADLVAYLNSQP